MQIATRTLDDKTWATLLLYQELRSQNANRVYLEVEAE
jgi:hypothetical protein